MEPLGGEDAVVNDVGDVGLRAKAAYGGGVVLRWSRLDGDNAEAVVAPDERRSKRAGAGLHVSGDGGITVDDQVAMRNDGGGIDLSA